MKCEASSVHMRASQASLRQDTSRLLVLNSIGVLLLITGCGGSDQGVIRVPVDVVVSDDGDPVSEGTLVLIPAEGNSGPKAVIAVVDGRASIAGENGPGLGRYIASFQAGDPLTGSRSSALPGDEVGATPVIAPSKPVDWEVTITAGLNELNLDLQTAAAE